MKTLIFESFRKGCIASRLRNGLKMLKSHSSFQSDRSIIQIPKEYTLNFIKYIINNAMDFKLLGEARILLELIFYIYQYIRKMFVRKLVQE
jgi:hypothetical protein